MNNVDTREGPRSKGAKGQMNFVRRVRHHWDPFSAPLRVFNRAIGTCFAIFLGEEKKMTSLLVFLTLWILEVFAGPSDENISMIKVQTKKARKLGSLRFDLLKIKMCRGDSRP